ncbi:spondin domain-containing protein [Croceivirga sp. JEA036]|uniref:spondin domain-containing protein n=1 Tax=Croceivirga sp. JEA036 TaxID=2721162 RepID=UPI00143C5F48|nr:spondin domain-containing protein [Croceivirga sp. JEA036]NJB35089.1 lamin tail domain-containing protein [Croceivirga sp. JEA036]
MKKNFLRMAALSLLVMACSEDDNEVVTLPPDEGMQEEPAPQPTGQASFVLNEVEYLGDRVEIFNNGNATGNLSGYFLCLGPGAYGQIGNLTTEGNINLAQGEYLTVFFETPRNSGGLGLYSSNQFTNAEAMVDFVQWGEGGNARENVAVDAGLWTAGEFVPVSGNAENTIIYDGEGNGVANWSETGTETFGAANELTMPAEAKAMIVINEVQYGNLNQVEIWNNGSNAIDLSDFWLCLGPGQYSRIGTIEPVSGSITLGAGEFLVLPYEMPDEQGGLGFYSTNEFTNAEAIVDFVQWGAPGAARENVAVEAGIWTAGEFVPTVGLSASIEYDGEGDSASDWSEEAIPSLGAGNATEARTTTFNVTISNVANYFNAHVFNTPVGASEPGPLTEEGGQYVLEFNAVPGAKISPVTMMGNSNDWFLAPEDFSGIDLWENGAALNGVDIASELVLYDLGTEADNDPASFPPAGANVGPDDPNPATRLVDRNGNRGDFYLSAILDYEAGDGSSAGTFTLTITKKATDFVVTPGIVVLHALENPLFTLGEEDRGVGLEAIAEDGNPMPLYNWFHEAGEQGAPLRLASSISVFSPGIVYAFNGDRDPFVLQGETNNPNNGLEEIAEDGNNSVAVSYLEGLGIPVAASNETTPVGPGGALTFTLTVPEGQNFKFGYSTMFVNSNDWFLAYNNAGYPLFDENGVPVSGTGASEKSYMYDSGTEIDEPVGFGIYQAPRQSGADEGPADENTTVRRVSELNDVQFGKGLISSGPGVVWLGDPRGGYNLVRVEIQPQ